VDVLALLNLKPVDPTILHQVERYHSDVVSSHEWRSSDEKKLFRQLRISNPQEFRLRIIATQLRQYVDEWLETGLSDDGRETLELRSWIRAPRALTVLEDYASKQDPRLRFRRVPAEFVVDVGSSEDPWQTSAITGLLDPIGRAWREVARLLFGLVTSDWGSRLCKCRYALCGRYFVHLKPRRSYKHGTFCGNHQMAWTATRQVKERRHLARSALIDLAATELLKMRINGPHWQVDRQRKIQLAKDISAQIRITDFAPFGPARLSLTWVTRNRQEIERRRLQLCPNSSERITANQWPSFLSP